MLLLTLRGTPTLYYGDELGMENVPIPPERERDPFGKNMPGTGQGRDPERTPMRWDTSQNAGFTTGEPGCRSAPTGRPPMSRSSSQDPASMLNLVRSLLDLRRREPALSQGDYHTLAIDERRAGLRPRGRAALRRRPEFGAEPKVVLFKEGELRGRIAVSNWTPIVRERM